MQTDKTISRWLFPCGTPIYFELCKSPPSQQSIKKRSMSIHITLLKFQVGTKFQCPQTKPSPDGYSHLEHQFLFVLCTSPPSYQSIKQEVVQYLLRFFNFGWGQNLNADRQNHLPRAIPKRSANIFWALHNSSFTPIYQKKK